MASAMTTQPTSTPTSMDPITAEVIRGAMETVAFEMATHVSLTATTPILNQSNERNATILDAEGRLAALSVGIPQFMLSSTLPVRLALEFFAEEGISDGDGCVANARAPTPLGDPTRRRPTASRVRKRRAMGNPPLRKSLR